MIRKPTKRQVDYWEQVLHDHRLGMGRGKSSKVDYAGGQEELYVAEKHVVSKRVGKKKPKGAKPE